MSVWCEFKIVRMYCSDQEHLSASELPEAVLELPTMSNLTGIQIFPDAELALDGHWQYPRISIGSYPDGDGYILQCSETASSESHLLATSSTLSSPEIYMAFGGPSSELWPKELFVPYATVMHALNHFLATGLQARQLAWIGLGAFPRQDVPSRPRRHRT